VNTHHVVVMGVSGCGKSTVGALLAGRLDADFLDGDSLHPAANVQKMAAGIPLNDDDRQPWLEEIGRRFAAAGDRSLVIACSALKRSYRDLIRAGAADARFIHLHGTAELLAARMTARPGHFMPPSLLASQLQTLEPLQPEEAGVVLDIAQPPSELTAQAERWLAAHAAVVRSA
jgi:carbohydrate kinase (thermoresistant glucokinase family)